MSRIAKALYDNDDAFAELADVLFGDSSRELIEKFSPVPSDLSVGERKRQKRQAQVGLATNVVGITAGTAATASSIKDFKNAKRTAAGLKPLGQHRGEGHILRKIPKALKTKRAGAVAAGAALGLQSLNLGGDAVANRVLSREAKKKVKKNLPVSLKPLAQPEAKVEFSGELSKLDSDKRQVFGWASVTKVDGQDVFDRQGDYIALEEIEKSAYHYVHHSRKGGDMHERQGEVPLHKSDMIESFVVTPEKLEKMGLEPDALPHGWWVGYQVNDDNLWGMVKDGKRVGFSIHGKGVRTPMGVI